MHRLTLVASWTLLGASAACSGSPAASRSLPPCTDADPFRCEASVAAWARDLEVRSYDGSGNNRAHPTWGVAPGQLRRTTTVAYGDGLSTPAREGVGPSARAISSVVSAQTGLMPNKAGASDFLWQWGQFIDHDLTLTTLPGARPEPFPIAIPKGDPFFDPKGTGTQAMPFNRSDFVAGSAPREQINVNTAFVDGSMVYGSDAKRATALRANDGTGRLLTTPGNFLPFNTLNLPNVTNPNAPDQSGLFVAGDERANEQVGLTAMHTLWLREHNRVAGLLHAQERHLTDDEVYQLARAVIGAEIEHITYDAFLPLLLGPDAIPAYGGYQPDTDPRIENLFTICYRLGHTLLSSDLQMVGPNLVSLRSGPMSLADAFFKPDFMIQGAGIEPVLRGLSLQKAEEVDPFVVGPVQNFLFGPPGAGGLDLVSLNIQRGRDHGLPGYNRARQDYGLPPVSSFAEISSDPVVQQRLASVYLSVDDIDPWIGALSEDHAQGAMVGPLLVAVVSDQFRRTRDGDRLWYENALPARLVQWVNTQTLSKVIRRNTSVGTEMSDDAFKVPK